MLKILGGFHRGKKLSTLNNLQTRPTSSFIREAIFNILQHKILNSKWLDLFSGYGSIGLEAISRGAISVTFVEKDFKVLNCLKKNISLLNENLKCNIFKQDVLEFIKNCNEQFDFIYIDPPYNYKYYNEILFLIEERNILYKNGSIIIEVHKDNDSILLKTNNLECYSIRKYGDTKLLIFQFIEEYVT